MMKDKPTIKSIIETFDLHIGLILFGALVNVLVAFSASRKAGDNYDLLDLVIGFIVAAFSGVIFGLTSNIFFDNENAVYAASGVGAFMGIKGLNIITNGIAHIIAKGSK